MKKTFAFLSILAIMLFTLNSCFEEQKPDTTEDQTGTEETDTTETEIPTAQAATFAEWQDNTADFTPKVPAYEIEKDLSNVMFTDLLQGPLSKEKLLAQNGFYVSEGWSEEFFSVYEDNRYQYIPSFVTTDSVLHTYHLYFNFLLKSLEENELYDIAVSLTEDMLDVSLEQYEALKGTQWEAAAKRNVGYFSLALKQFNPDASIDDLVAEAIEADNEAMVAHEGLAASAVMGEPQYLEDFSQYIPRGHYTKTEKLSRYFNALMWYGRMTFRLDKEDETKSSLLIMAALDNNEEILADWKRLYEPIGFFVGEADDLVYFDYQPVALDVYGELNLENLQSGDLDKFIEKAKQLRDPGVNSMPVLGPALAPEQGSVEDRTEQVKGFRFLGQRFTIDASVFQRLVCREVGNLDGSMKCPAGDSRMLPNGLDVTAAFGSEEAYEILDDMGETGYAKYPENMKKLKGAIAKLPMSQWGANIYWGWMYTLKSLLNPYGEGYPMFMQNEAWKRKELTTFLGSWAELKHDTILYAKQVYAELGGGPMIEERDDRGYVEPNPELYARLASLTQLTIDGLEQRSILSAANKSQLQKLYDLLIQLRDISVKELENTDRTEEEYELIRAYGGSLEHFWYETFSDAEKEKGNLLNDNPAPIIADVATDPNCCVLEVGTGFVEPIFVVFPIDDELHIGKGGVFSYYEFSWPMNDRLTDEKWRDEVLRDWENPPERLKWQTHLADFDE
ncbi:DUF3160 domain-containing protein [Patescibacteria group bacterium]